MSKIFLGALILGGWRAVIAWESFLAERRHGGFSNVYSRYPCRTVRQEGPPCGPRRNLHSRACVLR
jgi:hypothetical protein